MATQLPLDCSTALADDFYNLFNISKPLENDTQKPHPKFATYCRKFCSSSDNGVKRLQDKRRQELFDNLKRRRERILNNLRPLIAFIEDDVDQMWDENIVPKAQNVEPVADEVMVESIEESDAGKGDQSMQVDQLNDSNNSKKNRNKRTRNWRTRNDKDFRKLLSKQLMLSEWLVDVPADFYDYWYMVFCPRGKRTLVITANGLTKIYSRTGYFMFQFQSALPGGSRTSSYKYSIKKQSSILDCIYVEEEHKFYVLDVISWNGCTFLDCDTEFRFFWLHSRFAEEVATSDTTAINENNNQIAHSTAQENIFKQSISKLYSFAPISYSACTTENIQNLAKGPYQFSVEIDGVLFFHKRASYTPGITPLVCWLKLHMIPEILHISLG